MAKLTVQRLGTHSNDGAVQLFSPRLPAWGGHPSPHCKPQTTFHVKHCTLGAGAGAAGVAVVIVIASRTVGHRRPAGCGRGRHAGYRVDALSFGDTRNGTLSPSSRLALATGAVAAVIADEVDGMTPSLSP